MEINTSDVLAHQRSPIQSRKQGNKKDGGGGGGGWGVQTQLEKEGQPI